jgi:O-antigen/teichoic acid export membrane protein
LALVLIVFHEPLLGLFGSAFAATAIPFAILIVGQVFNVAMGPAGTVLLMTGHERQAARCFGIGAATNVVLACILVPVWGLAGGAVSATISLCVAAGLLTWSVHARLSVQALGLARPRARVVRQSR